MLSYRSCVYTDFVYIRFHETFFGRKEPTADALIPVSSEVNDKIIRMFVSL